MKNSIEYIVVGMFLVLFNTIQAQEECRIPQFFGGFIYDGIERNGVVRQKVNGLGATITEGISFVNCTSDNLEFEHVPDWITITNNSSTITIVVSENTTIAPRYSGLIFCNLEGRTLGVIAVDQLVGCYKNWYPDTDGDGFGDVHSIPKVSCDSPFTGAVNNNDDYCPDFYSLENNGCKLGYVHENLNWITSKSYDVNGNLKASSKAYFDDLGKSIQSQSLDIETGKTWATQTLYDAQGRPALQTLSAPIVTTIGTFEYKTDFIRNQSGGTYSETDMENAASVGNNDDTLGEYYSTKNTDTKSGYTGNNFHDVTNYPFSKTVYSELNPGTALKTVGGKQLDLNLETKSYSFTMPASQELSQTVAFNDTYYNGVKTLKTVVRDAHGVESVVFTDTDGRTLATARSGNEESGSSDFRNMDLTIKEQGFVDVHIPVGLTGITIHGNPQNGTIKIYDLITEQVVTTPPSSLSPGFYRVSITDLTNYTNNVKVFYKENYYDYSLNEYDKAGRLTASYQPLNKLKSEFKYNSLGQLLYSKSPDEGEAWFKYRKDGQIRYSQNSKQLAAGEFSYTNYDKLGRPVESGVLESTVVFNNLDPNGIDLPSGTTKEQQFTTYDALEQTDLDLLATLNPEYHKPTFLSGNVAKTQNDNTTTYYSYDVYGRVKWMAQDIAGLGLKTINYKYDPITGNVLTVDYQKHVSAERFIHKYTYNIVDQLIKVETSTDNNTFTEHAKYFYYETGALRRTELAENLQGIDYIYNLAGQLKAINDPDGNDPGNDGNNGFAEDVFSMTLDYYTGDYNRANIHTATEGTNQYNGNIKAMTWKTNHSAMPGTQTYYYDYNKNNWLKSAGLNAPVSSGNGKAIEHIIKNTEITANEEVLARQSITLQPDFHVALGLEFLAKIDPNATSNVDDGDYNVSGLEYDQNGNITHLNRNKHTENGSNRMDELSYTYKPDKNQLDHVTDAVTTETNAQDIKTQQAGNYVYNKIGQLVYNAEEGISYTYNTSGLVSQIQKNNVPLLKFFYNDKGHRVRKESFVNGSLATTTYYVRDASGSTLAVYKNSTLAELPIYGTSRLGVYYKTGNRSVYQLTDHLGNVRAVITKAGDNAAISSSTDYYPFGMPMPGRQIVGGEQYRYDYQGNFSEKDKEIGLNSFERRFYDARLMRWLTPDDIKKSDQSPYMGMGNNPILYGDPDGRDVIVIGDSKSVFGLGHAAVIIGSKERGWRYVSMNGTGEGSSPIGKSRNVDLGDVKFGVGLTAEEVINIANNINTKESHNYDTYRIVKSNETEDGIAYVAARKQAKKGIYCVAGQSCLDVPQAAVNALIKHRGFDINIDGTDRFGFDELIPNQWINDLGANARDINYFYNNPPTSVFQWVLNGFKNNPRPHPKVILKVGKLERIED